MFRYYYETGCLNVSVPFKAHPWNSVSKIEWWIVNASSKHTIEEESDNFRAFTKRVNSTDLVAVLGKVKCLSTLKFIKFHI